MLEFSSTVLLTPSPYCIANIIIHPSKFPFPLGDVDRHLIYGSLGSLEPSTKKQHLDRFSRFAGLTTVTDRQTDKPTDHATRSVTIGCIYVRGTAMQPNSITGSNQHKLYYSK